MSSDIYIDSSSLLAKGRVKVKQAKDGNNSITLMCFGNLILWREVGVLHKQIHVSCGGSFRKWLLEYLKYSNITHEMI